MLIHKITVSFEWFHGSDTFIGFKPGCAYDHLIILARFQKYSISGCERIFFFSINDYMESSKIVRDGARCNVTCMSVKYEL